MDKIHEFVARALALLLLPHLLAAQDRTPPPGVIRSVHIEGNTLYSSDEILHQLNLKSGSPASVATLEQARQRLQSTDLFSTVSYQFRFQSGTPIQYDVTYKVAEDTQVFPMHFERLGAEPAQILAYLKTHVPFYSDKIPGTASVLQRYKNAVQEFLAANSKEPVKVKAAVAADENQRLTVNFYPDAPIPTISQVLVSGNKAVDTGVILRAVNEVAIGAPLTDARVKLILNGAIKPVYAARGYPLVTFPKIESEAATTNLGVILKVSILDGPQFQFGPLRFRGKGLEEDEIRSALAFKPGEVFNSEKVESFRIELLKRMKRRGLLDATITPVTQPDEAKHVVNVIYDIVPGEVYHFQKLDVQGLDMNAQDAIEKLWGEKPGQAFNPEYPEFFLKRVKEQGLFDNLAGTQSDYTPDQATHAVTVHLWFKGGHTPEEKKRERTVGPPTGYAE
jgi:outer membrane protein insertion porin family